MLEPRAFMRWLEATYKEATFSRQVS